MTYRKRLLPRLAVVSAAVLLALSGSVRAEPAATQSSESAVEATTTQPEKFCRFVDDGHGGGSLETADVAYRNKDGATVHLVAAVHIGEKSYYQDLAKSFDGYDAVLYELVKPKDAAAPVPGVRSDNPVSQFQHMLKDVLDLDFQLDDIDYTKPNFVHADLDKETFEKLQEERGESFETLMIRQIMNQMSHPPTDAAGADEDSVQTLIKMFTRPDAERQVKVVLAKQLGNMDAAASGLDGPGGTVIVTERNKAALKVLSDTLAGGKKNVAIFYGAAHMDDMSKHLAEMGFTPVSTQWRRAWDLAIRPDQPSAVEKLLDKLFEPSPDDAGQ